MKYVVIRHRVADYPRWRRVFDERGEAQRAAGVRVTHVLTEVGDRNHVVLIFEVDDFETARAYFARPEVPEAMDSGGVAEEPEIRYLESR